MAGTIVGLELRGLTTMLLRGFVTALYVGTLLFGSALALGVPNGLPLAVLALTASYGILMLVIWLYQRFPPGSRP
jgi:hypothetical protein